MLNIFSPLPAVGTPGKGVASDGGSIDPEIFAKELNAKFKELTSRPEKIRTSMTLLRSLFPNVPIGSGNELSASSANAASRTRVNISHDLLAGMGESEEAADSIREIIESFLSSLNRPGAIDGKKLKGDVWRSLDIQAGGARFVDTYRDASGKTTLAASTLTLGYAQGVMSMFDRLIGGKSSSQSNRPPPGASGQGVFGDSWQFSAYFSFQSVGNSDKSQLGRAAADFGGMRANARIMVATSEMQAQFEGAEMEGGFSRFTMEALGLVDPLVFDLGGDGFDLRAMEDGVMFDMRGEGAAVRTAFIQGDDAFLYLDENGNGVADGVNELFGDSDGFDNGFEKLARHDGNGDGVIDGNDAIYRDLRLWRDLNGDGVNQTDESLSLADAGIKSIHLRYRRRYDHDGKGNIIGERSAFTRINGAAGMVADVWLKSLSK